MTKLLNCPFCGGKANVIAMDDYYMAHCECGANYEGPDAEDCAEDWNRRATPSPSTAPTEQNQAADLNVLPPFAAPAGQHNAGEVETLDQKAENALLWCYRRLKNSYGRLPFVEEAVAGLRERTAAAGAARQGGNTSTSIVESSTAPIAEDERAAFELWATITGPWAEAFLNLMWEAWQARAALASKPAAREAARQSIDTDEFSDLLGDYFGNAMRASEADDPSLLIPARRVLIAHIDTWGGATREEK